MGAPVHPIHVVQIDAHPDVYEDFEGSRSSHACVAARLLEMEHVASVTQLGIRTLNAGQSGQLERYSDRLRILYAKDLLAELPKLSHIAAGAPVYLTVDLDGLDPSVAPRRVSSRTWRIDLAASSELHRERRLAIGGNGRRGAQSLRRLQPAHRNPGGTVTTRRNGLRG